MKDLVAIIEEQERLALAGGQLAEDRIEAMDAYLGRPYGDEEEGRSQIVMRDVADTIEWIKPSLMKVFCAGDEVVVFNPVGAEDEEQAEQETDYCNHVLMQQNQGFLVLHDWFHDALLQKNGYVLVSHEETERTQKDRYQGLTDDEFAQLVQSDDAELLEHTQYADAMSGMVYHDAVVQSVKQCGKVKLTNIPPERVLVAKDWPGVSLEGCPFVEVIDYKTISELRTDGFDVDDNISDTGNDDDDYAGDNRDVSQDGDDDHREIGADAATRRVKVRYVWMQIDADKDGKSELHRIVVVGKTILEDEEDALIPVACATPYRVPHEHNGQSVYDYVEDIQRVRTALVRGFLDNMYLVNSPRYAVDAALVNMDDMLNPRVGGVVRVGTPGVPLSQPIGQTMMPMVHPADGSAILTAVEYVDTVRENRTGVTKYNQGLDANSLNKTMGGLTQIMSASQQRIDLIARIIAETGMTQLMLMIRAMSLKHGRQQEMVKLRNKWVSVDPRTWRDRRDVTVSVGLGTGNKDQMLQHLQMILLAQKEAAPLGLATPKNIFNALVKLTQNAGFKLPDEFWTDPEEGQGPPQAPNPDAIKAQADMQKTQLQIQADGQKTQATMQAEAQKQERQMAADAMQAEQDRLLELQKAQIDAESRERIAMAQLRSQEMQAELSAMVTIATAQFSAQQATEQAAMKQAQDQQKDQEREFKGQEDQARQAEHITQVVTDHGQQIVAAQGQSFTQAIAQMLQAMKDRPEGQAKVGAFDIQRDANGLMQRVVPVYQGKPN